MNNPSLRRSRRLGGGPERQIAHPLLEIWIVHELPEPLGVILHHRHHDW